MVQTAQVAADAKLRWSWRDIEISNREMLRVALIKKFGSLTRAAECLNIPYIRLSAAIAGREQIVGIVAAIQREMEIDNSQILTLWPLLKQWPRKSRVAC